MNDLVAVPSGNRPSPLRGFGREEQVSRQALDHARATYEVSAATQAAAKQAVEEAQARLLRTNSEVARTEAMLTSSYAVMEQLGATAFSVPGDISVAADATRIVAETVRRFERLDILVNAAGVMLNGPSVESPLEEWERMVDVNLHGLMYVTKAALPHLLETVKASPRRVADVVNISSVAGRMTAPQVAIYSATKFAVTAATESWRQEFTKKSLRFSVVEPGATATELFDQKAGQWEGFTQAFGEVERLHAEDIADTVHYIVASPRRVAINEMVIRPTDQA